MSLAPDENVRAAPPATPVALPRGGAKAAKASFRRGAVALYETLYQALVTLRAHKLRSLLTLLGVILAVMTLVSVMSLVAGLNSYVADKIANLGANVFIVDRFGILTSRDAWIKAQKRPAITLEEYAQLQESMKTAKTIAALEYSTSDVRSGNDLLEDVAIMGVTPNYPEVHTLDVSTGRLLTDADEIHHAPVCFIGADLAAKFFYNMDPIGRTIRAGSHSYQVVGVAVALGTVLGQSQDNFLLIPLGTFRKEWHTPLQSLRLFVSAQNAEIMESSQDEARMMMRAMRHQPWDAEDGFGIIGSASIMSLWQSLTANLFALALGLTAIFLVVGGIVIMNIMLASVTERTREIGLRRSLGARKRHILMQFVTESAVLSAVGGILGIAGALAIAALIRGTTAIPMRTPTSAIVLALALSTSVGLFFGIYPATRAARLDPIEALRAET